MEFHGNAIKGIFMDIHICRFGDEQLYKVFSPCV